MGFRMKKMNRIIYGLFGVGAILYGVAALLFPARLVSDAARCGRGVGLWQGGLHLAGSGPVMQVE